MEEKKSSFVLLFLSLILSTLDVMNLFNKNIFDIRLDFDYGLITGEFGSSDSL